MENLPDLVEEIAVGFRKDAMMLLDMASVYPGDPGGNLSEHAFILDTIADLITDGVHWDVVLSGFREKNKVTITYGEEEDAR